MHGVMYNFEGNLEVQDFQRIDLAHPNVLPICQKCCTRALWTDCSLDPTGLVEQVKVTISLTQL